MVRTRRSLLSSSSRRGLTISTLKHCEVKPSSRVCVTPSTRFSPKWASASTTFAWGTLVRFHHVESVGFITQFIGGLTERADEFQWNIVVHSGRLPEGEELLLKEDTVRLKRCIYATQRSSLPPITTHNIIDDAGDPVLVNFRRCQLFNEKHDRVKVLHLPPLLLLQSNNPVSRMMYFILGDLPSWIPVVNQPAVRSRLRRLRARLSLGRLPQLLRTVGLHSGRMYRHGYPQHLHQLVRFAIATSINQHWIPLCGVIWNNRPVFFFFYTIFSGFGCFMGDHIADPMSYGIYVMDRRFISLDESLNQLAQYMFDFTRLSRRQRIIQRNRTERLSDLLDWRNLSMVSRTFSFPISLTTMLSNYHHRENERFIVVVLFDWKLSPVVFYHWLVLRNTTRLL